MAEGKHAQMGQQLRTVREQIESAHPEMMEGYMDFVERYKEFLRTYRQFLGVSQLQQKEAKGENRWNP